MQVAIPPNQFLPSSRLCCCTDNMEGAVKESNNKYSSSKVKQNISVSDLEEKGKITSIIEDEPFVYEEEVYDEQLNPTSFIGKLLLSVV